ncbi:DUF1254 domain-containing protein [Pontiellaceae bacterium B12227]|nr:DUF1254 domain-containing protein [Pontiellaceae bacterium B12227]
MKTNKTKSVLCIALTTLLLTSFTHAKETPSPKYAADVPETLLTPDQVKTDLLGDLEFFDGMPSEATVQKSFDFLDVSRGVETFLSGMPAVSIYAMLEGLKDAGLKPGDLGLFGELMDARTLFLTAQSTTPYAFVEVDLKKGPVVVEIPGPVLGSLDDAFFRFVSDVGLTGPDQGKGGKYLFIGPDYEGEIPEGYFVAKSKTYRHWLFMRVFVKDGDLEGSTKELKEGFRCYPLAKANKPPKQKIIDLSGKKFNTIHANNEYFYEELNAVIQYEPADAFDAELVGLFASIGIKKGHPFAPDARMKKILKDAAAIGNASARSLVFRPRDPAVYFYPDRQWYTSFAGGHDFMDNGEMKIDGRTIFHYVATGITPAMSMPKVGTGSAYAFTPHDADGNYLDGGNTYKVTLPAPIPVNNFWSFMVYSGQHRSMLETDQKEAGLDSNSPSIKANEDGSYTVWFAPEAPEGHEGNWIQTVPGKSFNILLRLYGPLEPWFDKTWKPGDLELVK